jgi:hypothetical protein
VLVHEHAPSSSAAAVLQLENDDRKQAKSKSEEDDLPRWPSAPQIWDGELTRKSDMTSTDNKKYEFRYIETKTNHTIKINQTATLFESSGGNLL